MAIRKTVLVIDDEPDTVTYFTSLLEDNGYDTIAAENGEQGLIRMDASMPDLITLDVNMPSMSGFLFYKSDRDDEKFRDIPIIFITGVSHDFESYISTSREVPEPEGYLTKPIDPQKLLSLIESLIGATG